MNVLIVAIDEKRWGPARLPKFLQAKGFRVASLCSQANPLASTKYVERRFDFPKARSSHGMAAALHAAMHKWQPQLVIPADEIVVALLQHLMAGDLRGWHPTTVDTLQFSLGDIQRRDAMLFKNRTQELAREIGVRVPEGSRVRSLDEAVAVGDQIGYPLLVKKSFSWGGDGVKLIRNRDQLVGAYAQMAPVEVPAAKAFLRKLMGRDWFPAPRHLWLQGQIVGDPAMYSFVATAGRLHAGFAGFPRSTSTVTGPSTVVECGPHAGMAEASCRMAAAVGATGFVSFDFMIERGSGKAFLLECNPRPNQVSHLGERIGVDLCAALLAGLRAGMGAATRPAAEPRSSEKVALFPQEWLRASDSPVLQECYHDVPWDDERLLLRLASEAKTAHPLVHRARERGDAYNLVRLAKRSL